MIVLITHRKHKKKISHAGVEYTVCQILHNMHAFRSTETLAE